ncbi:MAG: bifunctional heptose 7-phosphate kinase/heptose 1-phosphate adenyltransferase [Cloacibacillus porcorum]|uniref:bifunctional heptose 7-phosphate kinase/heptose 1-phosphate adenyltransferase n=1 Tax=Cloacibacillus porcorum TaxID=1197717 RepID=UPI002355BF07|nr:bifunctional heptose 7-phosphate kinase/heptose 1-phosphate adenyltransferase [Cloacibacillus porcorum]MCI5864220.1 bifunctional heptose 7-phosphate kinase/heptose 1-phosphate adenyltransferase [Cloacibacillus porcorum]
MKRLTKKILSDTDFSRVAELLTGGFKSTLIVVAGDFMLDRYISGDVERISPEAPVPVIRFREERLVAGGAGNVAANLVGLGVNVFAAGSVGDDIHGWALLDLPLFKKIDHSALLPLGPTTVKTRLLGSGRQQMLRLDMEEKISPSDAEAAMLLSEVSGAVSAGAKLIIISDYGKGCCSPELCRGLIALARKKGVSVWVDPKKSDWESYRGASLITPNIKELSAAAGHPLRNDDEEITAAAISMIKKYGIENILVTRSERGATLIEGDTATHIPVWAVEVYDVSGAGDTMIAVAAAFAAEGLQLREAVKLANAASQVVIGKIGTYSISAAELLDVISERSISVSSKVLTEAEAVKLRAIWRNAGERVIFTNGCFDIIHAGHIDSLSAAKSLGDRLIVGLNSDASVRRLKGDSRPVNGEASRAKVLAALEAVDAVVVFEEDTPEELLSRLRPDVIAKGGDYRPEEVAGREYAEEIVILPLTDGFSTTSVIERSCGV